MGCEIGGYRSHNLPYPLRPSGYGGTSTQQKNVGAGTASDHSTNSFKHSPFPRKVKYFLDDGDRCHTNNGKFKGVASEEVSYAYLSLYSASEPPPIRYSLSLFLNVRIEIPNSSAALVRLSSVAFNVSIINRFSIS